MAKWFTFKELTRSATADRLGIDNTPKEEYIQDNIIELMRVLDGAREEWAKKCEENCWGTAAIIVNSGYRCDELNEAINGSKTSLVNSLQLLQTALCKYKTKSSSLSIIACNSEAESKLT